MNDVNPFEPYVCRKPIEEVLKQLKLVSTELSEIKKEMNHIKLYIRKCEARETVRDDLAAEYVQPSLGWFF
tara:strand:+ start:2729 stop:2941 length:213 start_codon:yes stop_codon:yes gene_type:complete